MNDTVVFYHADCSDGFCSAWLASKALVGRSVEFVPANYSSGEKLVQEVTDKDVYILDFSFKLDVLRKLIERNRSVVLLDHHQTAEADLKPLVGKLEGRKGEVIFDMTKSGCRLTLERFREDLLDVNDWWLVYYVEDRDLWRWELPHSKQVNAAIRSYPMTFDQWDKLAARPVNEFILEGEAILRSEMQMVDRLCKGKFDIDIGGIDVPAVNTPVLQSEVAGRLAEEGKSKIGCCFYIVVDNPTGVYSTRVSLRSTIDGPDVSAIASQLGGGGHKHAAGFVLKGGCQITEIGGKE